MTTVVNVSTDTDDEPGWRLRVKQANDPNGALFYGELHDRDGHIVSMTRAQPSAGAAVESATTWLLLHGMPHVCTSLRASAAAELRQ